jgi:HEAT repeat protein
MEIMTTKRKATKKSPAKRPRSARAAMSVATSENKPVKERVQAMAEAAGAVCEDDKELQSVLEVLRNQDEAIEVRLAALQSLQAASFSVVTFESCRSDYIATLRKVATDPNPELRQRVLGILAREKDGYASKKLLEGLKNPDKALVPPEKALQLLSYDIHAEAYQVARGIVKDPPNEEAKLEALRLLAADAKSAPQFEKLLLDKDETKEVRQVAAAALQALKPDKLQESAREILLDDSDYDEIKATSLTALTQFGDEESVSKDTTLRKQVTKLSTKGGIKARRSARHFITRYGK